MFSTGKCTVIGHSAGGGPSYGVGLYKWDGESIDIIIFMFHVTIVKVPETLGHPPSRVFRFYSLALKGVVYAP